MTPERYVGSGAEPSQGNTKERLKAVSEAGWFAVTTAGLVALAFSKNLVVQDIGAGIFLVNMLAPGVRILGETIKDIVKPTIRT